MSFPDAGAFLALWNGIADAGLQEEYETWHTFEHVPERVGVPGFVAARRYRGAAAAPGQPPHYFTLYRLAGAEALQTPRYQELLDRPTPWSARMRGQLRDFVRVPCVLGGSHGVSHAAQLVALHVVGDAARFAAAAPPLLQRLVDAAEIVRADWGCAIPDSAHPLGAAPAAGMVVLLEGLDLAPLLATSRRLLRDLAAVATAVSPQRGFGLLTEVRRDELQFSLATRQPARPDLFQRFAAQGDKP